MNPRSEYAARIRAREESLSAQERRHRLIGYLRLAALFAGAVLAINRPMWLPVAVVVFTCLTVLHERVIRRRDALNRAIEFYRRGLARLDGQWVGTGEPGSWFLEPPHPSARDLDLFGAGSLFELLCTARTRAGEAKLAEWLRNPASPDEILVRQAAAAELRQRIDLREDLSVIGGRAGVSAISAAFASWGEGRPLLYSSVARLGAAVWTVVGLASLVLWLTAGYRLPALTVVLVDLVLFACYRKPVGAAADAAGEAVTGLSLFAQLAARVEREPAGSARLAGLRAALETEGRPPSFRLARLGRLMDWAESRRNFFVTLIDPFVFLTFQSTCAVEAWRNRYGPSVRRWVDAIAEFEALNALAGYSFEHPDDPFPEIVPEGPRFEAEGLAHPLLPASRAVRNDLRLDRRSRVMIVSGSNMSGKSTLLRAVGTNAVLALCGAPVRARRLCMSPIAVGASVRVNDSIHTGTSRFYAEITQIRRVVELADGPVPALFLLDEFLQNTNSHDRQVGAEAIVRSLVRKGAIGLLTTQDLALTGLSDSIGPEAVNVHFEDRIEGGKLHFDYLLRPGIVTRSNAIDLMRSVGLDV
jgi:hypothetical protein